MGNEKLYAVLTGDLIGSSRFTIKKREKILSNLKDSFKIISPDIIASKFVIYRGDSFQGVLSRPGEALNAALIIRASLLSRFKGKRTRLDARIAIGIGTIDYLPRDQAGEGDGEAFRNSGPELDKIKKGEQNLIIRTPWTEINEELRTECALFDALIQRWTKEQAEAILYQMQGETQEGIAKILKISQPAVFQRLRTGGSWAGQVFVERFKVITQERVKVFNIMSKAYNYTK
jgi:hypothetical protein